MYSIRPRSAEAAIDHAIDLGLVDEFTTVSAFARKPVKITMTGPHLLAAVAYDEYYHDLPRMMTDLGKLLHQNFKRLAEAGCKHIQIDEPYFTVADDQEVRAAVDGHQHRGRGPAGRCARPGPHLPGQLRRRP